MERLQAARAAGYLFASRWRSPHAAAERGHLIMQQRKG